MANNKKIKASIKIQIGAKKANPSPPIGPALGQHGVNIMDFCKMFNEKTKHMEEGEPVSVIITVYHDKSFKFIIKTPPTSYLIKKILKLKSGSSKPSKENIGSIKFSQLKSIAEIKFPDMTASNINNAIKTIAGTAKSLGIKLTEEID